MSSASNHPDPQNWFPFTTKNAPRESLQIKQRIVVTNRTSGQKCQRILYSGWHQLTHTRQKLCLNNNYSFVTVCTIETLSDPPNQIVPSEQKMLVKEKYHNSFCHCWIETCCDVQRTKTLNKCTSQKLHDKDARLERIASECCVSPCSAH